MSTPYYSDESVRLFHGDMQDLLPTFTGLKWDWADAVIADPPYGETSHSWDQWVDGWPDLVAGHTRSMWCFGSMRMFWDHRRDFTCWKLAQDVVWEKHNGTGFATDRMKRVHELAVHFYTGQWRDIHHDTPREPYHGPDKQPAAVLAPLIEYSVPPGGVVLDPFAGSCSTLLAARQLGRCAVGIEADEEMCEKAAQRLSVPDLFGGAA